MELPQTERKIYHKANSFVGMRGQTAGHADVANRIEALLKTVVQGDNYHNQIVRTACEDALDLPVSQTRKVKFQLHPHVIEEIRRLNEGELSRYLFYRYRYDVFPVEQKIDDYPPCLQIEPTSICNYRCVFCYQTDASFTSNKSGFLGQMSLDTFKKVVDEAKGQCEAITLASRGEPLMCKDFGKMLEYLQGKFLAVKINTNAWFLDEKNIHAILQSGANTLVFSADSASEPLYSQLRVRGSLERVLKNIRLFRQIKSEQYSDSRMITRVSGVRFTKEQNLDDMDGLWGELVDQVAFVDYNPWENVYDCPKNGMETPCSDLWRRLFVWWDGVVNPCDVDYKSKLAIGNVATSSISELWRGEKYQQYREAHAAQKRSGLSPCDRCTVV
ncbi:MAG: radical SAM protein [Deltaproteobacteria bacterium]|nr:radical SAM protein [Deltaproteobacteria bacterium]MBI3294146.1 radical SAM protein [Deltaproteobacteria bacterium]